MAIAQSLAQLIAKRGRSVDLARKTAGVFDPDTGGFTPTYTSRTIKALPISPGVSTVRGTLITFDKLTFLMARLQPTGGDLVEPTPADRIVDGAAAYEIDAVRPIDVDGAEQAWFVEVKGA